MVFVKLTSMYDLSTAKDKMGIIAVKTPNMSYVQKKWSGLLRNFKYIRLHHCNVRASCASMLPADPLQVGIDAGQVAPQDLFNPILYKIVSNDSWEGVINRIYAIGTGNFTAGSGAISGSAGGDAFPSADAATSTNAYYGLLADDSFRKVHPQAGLNISGVRPFVFPILNTIGTMPTYVNEIEAPQTAVPAISSTGGAAYTETGAGSYLKGHAVPMPRLQTYPIVTESTSGNTVTPMLGYIPPCYCIAIVTPPSAQTILYYRIVVEWVVEFIELRSDAMLGLINSLAQQGSASHYSNFYQPSSKLEDSKEVESGALEVEGVEATLVMEK